MRSSFDSIRRLFLRPGLLPALLFLTAGGLPARTIYLSPQGKDANRCRAGAEFASLARAVECLGPGDTLFIRNGTYQGGVEIKVQATAGHPTVIRGESLEAVIEGSGEKIPDAIRVQDAAHLVLENFTARNAGRAGAAVRHSHHVRIFGCRFADNNTWGIFTSFADDIHFENNETCGSKVQHGIYHSNSGDRFVIRGNRVHHNSGNGIHLNGDPEIPGGDGVLNEGLVERNIIYENGKSGGAGINMTHVHDVLVRNNLLYNNYAGGMTVYQDTGTFEQGSKRVVITGNTVFYQPGTGRSGVNVQTTSEKVVVAGNIFISGGKRGNIEVNSDHLETVFSDCNVLWGVDPERCLERKDEVLSLERWRSLSMNDRHSIDNDPLFVDPAAGDFRPASGSPAVDAGMSLSALRSVLERLSGCDWLLARLAELPQEDLAGNARPTGNAPDAGVFEAGGGK